jgi:6-pyruvoyltetrahydropterin/6-carboxytetrahydropterin synthase
MYRIGVKKQFSAAHRLEGHPGRCSRLHGHTWSVEAVFSATDTGADGMVVDFDQLGSALGEAVGPFDHVCLNDVEPFDKVPPTAENVARVVYKAVAERVASAGWAARLELVTVWESREAWASFSE